MAKKKFGSSQRSLCNKQLWVIIKSLTVPQNGKLPSGGKKIEEAGQDISKGGVYLTSRVCGVLFLMGQTIPVSVGRDPLGFPIGGMLVSTRRHPECRRLEQLGAPFTAPSVTQRGKSQKCCAGSRSLMYSCQRGKL